jgi:CubicO group peptidase (beta-lactamase class C family)
MPAAPMHALVQVTEWPVDQVAAAVLRFHPSSAPGGTAPGTVELAGATGAIGHPFPWASVTKPATALAALIAVEEGTLSLDEPAGPPGSTVRHLLAHTSGLGPEDGPALVAPGARRIYSNAGYRVLADLLADRAGLSFGDYLGQGILGPLGMTGTTLDPDAAGGLAAAGLVGPVVDLAALASEWAVPTLVSPETHQAAITVQYPGTAGVLPGFQHFDPCDWGLGVEIRGAKQPHWTGTANSAATFGHFGRSGSFVWVDPVAGVACAGLGDRPFGPWAARAWPILADSVLAEVAGGDPAR